MGNTDKDTEKRRSARIKAEFLLTYKVDKAMETHMWIGNREVDAVMLDLGGLGMAILTHYDIALSVTLLIKFNLVNFYANMDERVRSIKITGEVRSNIMTKENEHRLGIAFTQIDKKDKRAILNFVRMAMNR